MKAIQTVWEVVDTSMRLTDSRTGQRLRPNKGVAARLRVRKRMEAEHRNSRCHPELRRSFARQFGYSRNSERIRDLVKE